jgi:small subunit ribosomal protein S4
LAEKKCRLCRTEGAKLFLKGEKCFTEKCPVVKRKTAPGQHKMQSKKLSDYGEHLREKQKAKRIYGIRETQFKNYFLKAKKKKGVTGEILLQELERRLDNVVYRAGFSYSRREARQLISHRHFLVNNKIVNIPSYQVKIGDVIQVREKSRNILPIQRSLENPLSRERVSWLEIDKENFSCKVISLPSREEMEQNIREQLIVEFYSR